MVGAGKNLWPDVDIEDGESLYRPPKQRATLIANNLVADLYLVLFDAIRKDPTTGHGREGYYFGENGEHSLYEVGKAIGEALVALGKSDNPEPTTFTKEEIDKYFEVSISGYCALSRWSDVRFFQGSAYLGSNSRARANHSRAIGWKPVKTKADFLASIKPEVETLAAKTSKA
jgi:hypothetical protein